MSDVIELQIAATALRGKWSTEGELTERLLSAMRAIRKADEGEVFFMSTRAPNDDLKFRTAIAAVMLSGSDEDRDVIERSMRPIKALSAMLHGIPVDVEAALANSDDCIPLMKLWHESKT